MLLCVSVGSNGDAASQSSDGGMSPSMLSLLPCLTFHMTCAVMVASVTTLYYPSVLKSTEKSISITHCNAL